MPAFSFCSREGIPLEQQRDVVPTKASGLRSNSDHPSTIKNKKPQTSWGFFIFCSGGGIRTHDLRIMIPTL